MAVVLHEAGPDTGAPWHYGDPLAEQRALASGEAVVDKSHRPVFSVTGGDRLGWLNALTTQQLTLLPPGQRTNAFILDPQGRIEHSFGGHDDGNTFWGHTEPGHLEALLEWLEKMKFSSQVEMADVSATHAVIERSDGNHIVERDVLEAELGAVRAGMWASEALRIAAGRPRAFVDTDDKTIPNEIMVPIGTQLLGDSVHLAKGCYRGQETVARVHTLGRPPRRLTLLHLDGSTNHLPEVGTPLMAGPRTVGRLGSVAIHHELGPIALALVKRNTPVEETLQVDGVAASQEVVVDPEVGLHVRMNPVRPRLADDVDDEDPR